jgi:hypothetical protein
MSRPTSSNRTSKTDPKTKSGKTKINFLLHQMLQSLFGSRTQKLSPQTHLKVNLKQSKALSVKELTQMIYSSI